MTVIIGQKEFDKKGYWHKRLNEKLGSTYDGLMPAVKEMKQMAEHTDVDGERLKAAFMIIAHGFDQAQGVINGQEINDSEVRARIEEEKVKEAENGRQP